MEDFGELGIRQHGGLANIEEHSEWGRLTGLEDAAQWLEDSHYFCVLFCMHFLVSSFEASPFGLVPYTNYLLSSKYRSIRPLSFNVWILRDKIQSLPTINLHSSGSISYSHQNANFSTSCQLLLVFPQSYLLGGKCDYAPPCKG